MIKMMKDQSALMLCKVGARQIEVAIYGVMLAQYKAVLVTLATKHEKQSAALTLLFQHRQPLASKFSIVFLVIKYSTFNDRPSKP